MDEYKTCPFCGKKIKQNAVFCRYCKRDLVKNNSTRISITDNKIQCPKCDFPNPIDALFCSNCGESLRRKQKVENKVITIIASIIFIFIALFITSQIIGKDNSPSSTVEGFANALRNGDIRRAVDYMSDNTVENMSAMFDLFIEMAEEDPDAAREIENELGYSIYELKRMDPRERLTAILENTNEEDLFVDIGDFKIIAEEIDGDNAVVTIQTSDGEEDIYLIKEHGKWKIDISF